TVIVTDSKGCTATTTVTITEPAALTLSDVSSNVTCNGNHDGSIDLSVAGGTGPFTYSWSNGSTSQDLSGLGPGTYSVTVTDASACTATTMISITEPAVLAASAVATNVDCNGNASGSIDLSITGGTGPFTYSWSSGATTEDLNGLTPGTYSVTVTDANGCIVSTSATITEPIPLTVSTTSVNILCNGFATGSIDLTVAGGTTAYSYLWSNGATTQDLNNLVAGTYSVTVTDANLCTATTSVTITQPPAITLTTSQVDITCKGDTDGSIDLSVSGGTGAYSYSWSSGETTQDLSGLAAGSYTVTVTDANGCTANSTITITEPPTLMTATYTQTNVSCNGGSDANIDITVADGTAPISYAWSNGATSEDLTNIPAGSYSVVITDALGCITIKDIVITEPSLLTASATKVDVDCNGNSSGSIDLSVAGGVAPYTYSWSNGASTQDLTNIGGGTYSVVVTDANGCTVNVSSTVVEPAAIVLTQDVTHVSCNGGADGAIDITIAGGRAPYRYAWNSGSTSQDLTNLSAGTYIVTATDYNGCTETLSIQITEPGTALSASVTVTDIACKGENTGAIDLTVTGGTAPYNYAWSSGATTEDVSSLPAGSYDVTITDNNNCITLTGITISEPAAVLALTASNQNVTCNGGTDGFINVTVSGGTTPYSYAWSNGATTQDLNNLTAGNYSLTLTDANGCVETASYTISEPNALTINLSQTDVSCFGEDNGAIDATVSGGTAPYTYNWSNGESTEDISNLVAGNYTLNLVDANGCTSSASVTITEPSELTLSSIVTDAGCNGGTNGAIDLSVLGGTAPYTYSWSNGSTSEDLTGLTFGAYTVTVTDANGCNTDLVVNVNEDASFFVNPNLTNVSCNNGNDGAVDLDVTGGLAPFSFSWSNGATTEDINGLTAGVYTVTIVDANGCTSISQVEITEPDEISTLISSTDIQCNGSTDGTLTLDLQGGTAPYGITVNVIPGTGIQATVTDSNGCSPVVFGIESTATGFPATATASISGSQLVVGNLGAGTYDITRPDLGGTLIGSEIINEPASLSILATTTDVSCNGGNDGAIDLSVTGGIGNYTYSWSNDRTTADLGSLASGSYTVTVSDANGCSTTASFNISEPLPISVSAGIQDVLCYGGSNGRINLSVSGGTGGYTYSWSNGSTASLLNNISAGNYTVLVTDANGCTVQETFEVKQPTQIVLDVDVANLSCFGAGDGSINLSVSGGGGGYTFLWSTGATTEDISGLSAGTYSVTV
ncbi:MAG: SprB repeat-containing protein, partial [Cytophagia bacterium]|nr:SprB repeat-containing protein [Cytophagia bacterium]